MPVRPYIFLSPPSPEVQMKADRSLQMDYCMFLYLKRLLNYSSIKFEISICIPLSKRICCVPFSKAPIFFFDAIEEGCSNTFNLAQILMKCANSLHKQSHFFQVDILDEFCNNHGFNCVRYFA